MKTSGRHFLKMETISKEAKASIEKQVCTDYNQDNMDSHSLCYFISVCHKINIKKIIVK